MMHTPTLFDLPPLAEKKTRPYKKGRSKSGRGPAGCHPGRPMHAKGLCNSCYAASNQARAIEGRECLIEGCDRTPQKKGMCNAHYSRAKAGLPMNTPIRVKKGSGSLNRDGYRYMKIGGRRLFEHRLVMEQMLGRPLLPTETVHHRNGQRDDNRPENLELWSSAQPRGQRVVDLIAFMVEHYPEQVLAELLASWESDSTRQVRRGIRG